MTEPNSNRVTPRATVATAGQAQALLDYFNQELLAELLEQPSSASVLAEALGVTMNALHYRLRKLEGLELIRVKRVEKRPGRGVKVYEPTAFIWDIPFALTPAANLREFTRLDMMGWVERNLDRMVPQLKDTLNLSFSFGKLNAQRAYLEYNFSSQDAFADHEALVIAQTLRLRRTRAEALRRQLQGVIAPFLHDQDRDGEDYTFSLLYHTAGH